MAIADAILLKLWGNVKCSSPLVTVPSAGDIRQFRQILKPSEWLTYALAIELQYPGEMAELDSAEFAATYLPLWKMELASVGTGVSGGIRNNSEFKVWTQKHHEKPWCWSMATRNFKQESMIWQVQCAHSCTREFNTEGIQSSHYLDNVEKSNGIFWGRFNAS